MCLAFYQFDQKLKRETLFSVGTINILRLKKKKKVIIIEYGITGIWVGEAQLSFETGRGNIR